MRARAATTAKAGRGGVAAFVARSGRILIGLTAFALLPACGQVTPVATDLCAGACDAGPCGQSALTSVGSSGQPQCAATTPAADAGASRVVTPSDVYVPACTICRRAENCCKASGHADCGYTAACANASTSDEQNQILIFCYALVDSGHDPAGRRCGEY